VELKVQVECVELRDMVFFCCVI